MTATARQMNKEANFSIDDFVNRLNADGNGAKKAEANTETGGYTGETTHTSKKPDDRTEPATTGAQAAANEKLVKADQGAPGVDATPEAKPKAASILNFASTLARGAKRADEICPTCKKSPCSCATGKAVKTSAEAEKAPTGTAADDQIQVGTNKQPTGDDPAHETNSAKAIHSDSQYKGPSTHPARTDNNALDGHKYASLDEAIAAMEKLGNDLMVEIANAPDPVKAAAASPHVPEATSGVDIHGLIDGTMKQADCDRMVQSTLDEIVKTAQEDADAVGDYLEGFAAQEHKQATEAKTKKPESPIPASTASAPENKPPASIKKADGDGPPPAGAGGGDEAELAGAAAGGGGQPGGGGDAENAQILNEVLQQLGITPEEAIAIMQQEAGAGGGMPPDAGAGGAGGGMPPGMGGGMPPGMGGGGGSLQPSASDKSAAVIAGTPEQKSAQIRGYLTELVRRSHAAQLR